MDVAANNERREGKWEDQDWFENDYIVDWQNMKQQDGIADDMPCAKPP